MHYKNNSYEVVYIVLNIAALILSYTKWRNFVIHKDKMIKATTAQIILFLMCCGSIVRIIQGVDVGGKHGIYTFDAARLVFK